MLKSKKKRSTSSRRGKSRGEHIYHPLDSKILLSSLMGTRSIKWTFSKADRFSQKLPEKGSEYQILKSSMGSGRKAGFGYGKRWEPSNPRGKDSPASTTYSLPSSLDRSIVGGKISPSKLLSSASRWTTPGPGSYELRPNIGSGLSASLKSRHVSLQQDKTPCPGAYNPKHQIIEPSRYACIAFGEKLKNDNISRITTPGPGAYDLWSSFSGASPSPTPKKPKENRKSSF
jgi:hypothetical protein